MKTDTSIFKSMSYDDDGILNMIKNKNKKKNWASFKLAVKRYKTRISENRLLFIKNKNHIWALAFDDEANKMQKKLDSILSEKE